ncbi:hypothetical protein C5L14_01130 [Labrys okinawensis]|uniref:Uncharacterized protein n=1 Tax=Labrys okinawensis TaxID=346911 RepID=A0A2S9QIP2_9HYPH|nr:hypothetical protein [Labrys okinawensis]PRH89227.1 hypothetical protein C5L14_01130 [Labrys okinawensis]
MKFLLKAWGPLLLTFALAVSPILLAQARAQIITNGGFETTTGWTYSGGSTRTQEGTIFLNPPAHSGSFYGTIATGGGTISQSITIPTAGTYQLSFYLAPQISLSIGFLNFSVQIGGVTYNLTYGVTIVGLGGYNLYTLTVNLPAGVTNLVFTNLPGLLTAPLRLDDVSLVQIPGPVPGTSTISYLAVALLILIMGRKKMRDWLRWFRSLSAAGGS